MYNKLMTFPSKLDRHVVKFQPILQESELRRFKGIRKANAEMHEVTQKQQQISKLLDQLNLLNTRYVL